MALDQLDLKLWVALACPTSGLEFDKTTLTMMDTDQDGRVRAPELIAAVKWAGSLLKNPDDLLKGAPTLRVAAINDASAEGKLIATFARQVLGKADGVEITIDEAGAAAQTFAAKPFNGDGIVSPDCAGDEATKAVIQDILACLGADPDASGKPGVSQAKVDQFFADAAACSNWWKQAEGDASVLPLGLKTPAAAAAIRTVKAKVDDFFTRCRLAAFDSRALGALNRDEKEYLALAAKDLTMNSAEIGALPLARVAAGAGLPLREGVNPAWASAMAAFQAEAVQPLLGDKPSLGESEWAAMLAQLAPYESWNNSKAGGSVEKLGLGRIREILAGKTKETLQALIAKDKAEAGHAQAVLGLNRLVHYHRDLIQLCHNFVSFRDFYRRKDKAIFQAGTLYLDQRSCDLCLTRRRRRQARRDGGIGGHLPRLLRLFSQGQRRKDADCRRLYRRRLGQPHGRPQRHFLRPQGPRLGRHHHQAHRQSDQRPAGVLVAPYKKLVRMIEEQVAKRVAAASTATDAKLAEAAKAAASGEVAQTRRAAAAEDGHGHTGGHRPGLDHPALGFGRHLRPLYRHAAVADSNGHPGHPAGRFHAFGDHGVHEAAAAEPRPDPGCQRLGGERQSQDERAVRRIAHRRGGAAARLAAGYHRPVCREEKPLAQGRGAGHPADPGLCRA